MSKPSYDAEALRGLQNNLFATKPSVEEAVSYIRGLHGDPTVIVSLYIFGNTLLESLARKLEDKDGVS